MSYNRNKTTMCNICGKIMQDDNMKKHKSKKHSNLNTSLHHGDVRQPIADLVIDNQHNDEMKAEDSEMEELNYTPLTHNAKLEFELQRDKDNYRDQKRIIAAI